MSGRDWKRINGGLVRRGELLLDLDLDLDRTLVESGEDVVIALDASGVKVSNRGGWVRRRWRVRRGYLKTPSRST